MALGCLMYIMVSTRPDIAHALSVLSRFMSNPRLEHWHALKCLLRYLKGTQNYGLVYKRVEKELELTGYMDADYASNEDTKRSTAAYIFMKNGNYVCWKAQLQSIVVLSSIEAKFMARTEAFNEAIWLKGIL
ncbi:secreted RxLR effector protein 161-like [Humulus lupulus]|uniref:secreted RxLR effector protein 161-like n=1 Tax=Humulus lupulus TaxID=3486 RepID=UPI002B4094D8|nr:secreted RxLR effector protein 161-like [Humulus lupulus]